MFDKSLDESVAEVYEYSGSSITGFSITDQGAAVSVTTSSKNEIIAFDNAGNLLYNDTVGATVTDVGLFEGYIFLQTETEIIRLDPKSKTEERLSCGGGKMLLYNANTAVVCGESKAQYLIF